MMQRFTWPQSPRRPRSPSSVDSSDFSSRASFASEASEEGQEVSGRSLVNTDTGSSFQYRPSLSVRSRLINHPNLIRNPTREDHLSHHTERKKVVLKLDFDGDRAKRKVIKAVLTFPGIDSLAVDMKVRKLTVIGSMNPIDLVIKLRKLWHTEILTVEPTKEPENKEEPKEEETKKEEPKKEEKKKEVPKKEEVEKKNEEPRMGINVANPLMQFYYNGQMPTVYHHRNTPYPYYVYGVEEDPNSHHRNTPYYVYSAEEDPNSCTIM